MKTVKEVSKLTGVSIRTLQYYDELGLLPPCVRTEAGYRLYDAAALQRLQQILLFRELEFPLKEIKRIIDAPNFDREKALDQQIELLTLRREHLDNLIDFAQKIKEKGAKEMDFSAFDKSKEEEYARQAKEQWGNTAEYKEFEEKHQGRSDEAQQDINKNFMKLFEEFGQLKDLDPEGKLPQAQVEKLQAYITEHFYTCSREILASLGQMYAAGGEFTENIDKAGGTGTATFTARAIEIYCK